MSKFFHQNLHSPNNRANTKRTKSVVVPPYKSGTFEVVERILRPMDITILYKPTGTLRSALFNGKDHVEHQDQSLVVYAIPCFECHKQYVGETSKQLCTRLRKHSLDLQQDDLHSQIWNQCAPTGHEVNTNNTKVVRKANRKKERLVLEAFHTNNSFTRHAEIERHDVILTRPTMQNRETYRRTMHQNLIGDKTVTFSNIAALGAFPLLYSSPFKSPDLPPFLVLFNSFE